MWEKPRFLSMVLYLALILTGILSQSCKSRENRYSPYQVERKTYYHDLIPDIIDKGRTITTHTECLENTRNPLCTTPCVVPMDIRPVDMQGANRFSFRSYALLMKKSGSISKELFLPEGRNRIVVQARGTISKGESARMRVIVDDTELREVDVCPVSNKYIYRILLKKGIHRIELLFLNGSPERKLIVENIHVDKVVIDYFLFIQEFMKRRLLDDTLNMPNEGSAIIVGKVGSVSRRSLFLPAPSLAESEISVPKKATLHFEPGIDEYVWGKRSSGCIFKVFFVERGKSHILYKKKFQPHLNKADRAWQEVEIDLARFRNKKGTLRFEAQPLPSKSESEKTSLGFFLLANPRVIVPGHMPQPNIILISIDTLRRDHLGIYGYKKETSPFLNSLAGESTVFDRAIAQAPYTLASHMTMMTSLWPSVHQILAPDYQERLSTAWLTLPQILKASGYLTAGFTGGGQVSAVYGFDRGMDVYDFEGGRSEKIFPKAMKWISKTDGNPFFLFLHTYDVHMPYEPSFPFNQAFDRDYEGTVFEWTEENGSVTDPKLFNRIIDLYDGEILYVDSQIRILAKHLEDEGLYDNTMIIITSDHGEEFMEHGAMAVHSHSLYNELLNVPLIIKFPGGRWAGRTIRSQVALVDLMPTVLAYLGIPRPFYCRGKSLVNYLQSNADQKSYRYIFSERIVFRDDPKVEACVQTLSEKYYQRLNASDEYYNLIDDPGEKNSLSESHQKMVSKLLKKIREYVSANGRLKELIFRRCGKRQQKIDKDTASGLKALGYIE